MADDRKLLVLCLCRVASLLRIYVLESRREMLCPNPDTLAYYNESDNQRQMLCSGSSFIIKQVIPFRHDFKALIDGEDFSCRHLHIFTDRQSSMSYAVLLRNA